MSQATISSEFAGSTMDRLASMAHETIDRVTPKATRAELEVRGAALKAADSAKALQEHATAAVQDGVHTVRSYAERNPLITVGIALATGALLSALIRR